MGVFNTCNGVFHILDRDHTILMSRDVLVGAMRTNASGNVIYYEENEKTLLY